MKRRDLIASLAATAAAWPLTARAQQPRRIGFLSALLAETQERQLAAFRRGLEETGYAEGRNLVVEYRWGNGDYARLPELATGLVRSNVEVIATGGASPPAVAAMQATKTIPIVSSSNGAEEAPLVKHFNRPEANLTAVDQVVPRQKRLQILAEVVPGSTIGVLANPTYRSYEVNRRAIEEAADKLGLKLAFAHASTDAEFESAFAGLARERVGALLIDTEPFLASRSQLLVALAARFAIPTMHEWRDSVVAGGLISYAPEITWAYYQVGRYTGQVLNGAKPADLPVIAPTKFELVINLKTAKALGLTVPQALFARADEVIE